RSRSGATGTWAGTAGCGIVVTVAPDAVAPSEAEPDPLAPVGEAASLLLVQAPGTSATRTIRTSRAAPPRRAHRGARARPLPRPPRPEPLISVHVSSVVRDRTGQSSFEPS